MTVAVLFGLSSFLSRHALAEGPRSQDAQAAIKKAETKVSEVETEYVRGLRNAKRQLVEDLKQAQLNAVRRNDADEATNILNLIKQTEIELGLLEDKPLRLQVSAREGWKTYAKLPPGTYVF